LPICKNTKDEEIVTECFRKFKLSSMVFRWSGVLDVGWSRVSAIEQGRLRHVSAGRQKQHAVRAWADLHDTPGRALRQLNLFYVTDLCTERDSLKDKLVVYAFILLTVGLLGYAAFEPYLKKKIEVGMKPKNARRLLT